MIVLNLVWGMTVKAKFLVVILLLGARAFGSSASLVDWKPWTDDVFTQAKTENRFVLLYLEAVWCHWCHVMDEKTYRDPKVVALVKARYLPVRVDQDSRPDLSLRYEEYGWPATVVFDGAGQEIVKRRGYIEPDRMANLLQAIIDDPSPGPSVEAEKPWTVPTGVFLSAELEGKLRGYHKDNYDKKYGGWGERHKFMDWDLAEWAILSARQGDREEEKRVRATLNLQQKLLDPVWGGIYQYSAEGWNEPHFEKLIRFQAENIRLYSLAYALWGEKAHLKTAEAIARYVHEFLTSPEGGFYVSQDADLKKGEHSAEYFKKKDAVRRKLGIPAIDKNQYARENGWMIRSLALLYGATGKKEYLERAEKAALWAETQRALPGGGFRHREKDQGGPYLDDSLAMGQAYLALYGGTGSRDYLKKAESVAAFLQTKFAHRRGDQALGYTASASAAGILGAKPNRDENGRLVRFANLLHHYTGNPAHRSMAETAMRYLAVPEIAEDGTAAPVLIANWELQHPPVHLTVVGGKGDEGARRLMEAALKYPSGYMRLDWWDRAEGKLPNQTVTYPDLAKAAAFACTASSCSLPIFDPGQLRAKVDRIVEEVAKK